MSDFRLSAMAPNPPICGQEQEQGSGKRSRSSRSRKREREREREQEQGSRSRSGSNNKEQEREQEQEQYLNSYTGEVGKATQGIGCNGVGTGDVIVQFFSFLLFFLVCSEQRVVYCVQYAVFSATCLFTRLDSSSLVNKHVVFSVQSRQFHRLDRVPFPPSYSAMRSGKAANSVMSIFFPIRRPTASQSWNTESEDDQKKGRH